MTVKKSKKPKGYTIQELAKILPISENALHQRCVRMFKGECVLYFNGFGWYSVTKPKKQNRYILFLIKPEQKKVDTDEEVKKKLVNILKAAKKYVCTDCSAIIQKMIENAGK